MFSKTATERFASVAGAIRERAAATGDGDDGGMDGGDDEEMSVADQIKASQEQLRSGAKVNRFTPALVRKITVGFIILFVIIGLVLSTPALIRYLVDQVEGAQAQPSATTVPRATTVPDATSSGSATATTAPEVTEPTTETAPPFIDASVFELGPGDFAMRWNGKATVSPEIQIDRVIEPDMLGLGFTEFLGLEWSFDDDGTMASYRLVLDPRGDSLDDALGLQALGVAINVAEPDLEGPDLRAVLMDLGLDVEEPTLDLNGSVNRDGMNYRLVYQDDRGLIILTIEPASKPADDSDDQSEG